MQVPTTQPKNQFGAICAHAKTAPVIVKKGRRIDTVIASTQQFEALKIEGARPSEDERKKSFERQHKLWLAEQTARFERMGRLWCDEHRIW